MGFCRAADSEDKVAMQNLLDKIADVLPANQWGNRGRRLITKSKKGRMHHFFVLAGRWHHSEGTVYGRGGGKHTVSFVVDAQYLELRMCANAGPLGSYLIELCEAVGSMQRLACMRMFQAIGDLWVKEIPKTSMPALALRTLEAICFMELHLPASEADVKLHNALHLAFQQIPEWGECFQHIGNLYKPNIMNHF